ncbi:MAG TPA: hypothetical protein VEZ11_05340 [Thermoanaerobaculia bacterium]|nr:hypothetical protein [Thermoanaerobaculia bacterium]
MSSTEPATAPPSRGKKTTTIAVVVVVLAFMAGLFVGIAGDRIWLFRHQGFFTRTALDNATTHMLDRLDRELELSPAQREQVRQILEHRREKINAIWSGARPQIRHEIDEANGEIERLLTPDQRTKFQQIKIRFAARHHDRR